MNNEWPAPTLVRRTGDLGWIAVSDSEDPIRIAVVGDSQQAAGETFDRRRAWWESIGWMPDPGPLREHQYGGRKHGQPTGGDL